jgi:DNA-binding beta-propeller fold protein YncE
VTWKYRTLYDGKEMPDSPTAIIREATAQRMSPSDYAAKKYDFAGREKAKRDTDQKAHDDAIRKETEEKKDREWSEKMSSNPDLRRGEVSGFSTLQKAVDAKQRPNPLGMTREERHRATSQAIQKDIATNAVAVIDAGTGKIRGLIPTGWYPNGLALSPVADVLYVSNADRANPVWLAFPVRADGELGPPREIFDARAQIAAGLPGVPDGLEVDAAGHIFAAAPGGVHVLMPDGTRLGTLWTGVATGNVHVTPGMLFVAANDTVYRIPLAH